MSNITTTNPCGMPMAPLPQVKVPYGSTLEIDLTFNGLLEPPLRVYPVVNNEALDGQQGKHEQVNWLHCPAPFDYHSKETWRWNAVDKDPDPSIASVNGDALEGWRWSSRDFVWFHIEELRNETIGYGYQTTKNFTLQPSSTSAATGLRVAESAVLILGGLAFTALVGFTL